MSYIPIKSCKDGYLYLIDARNSKIGIYWEQNQGFEINRIKFDRKFLFIEYHWDTGEPFGTVKPYKEIEEAPSFKDVSEKMKYLDDKEKEHRDIIEIIPGNGFNKCKGCRTRIIKKDGYCFLCGEHSKY